MSTNDGKPDPDPPVSDAAVLCELLRLAVSELRQHNQSYHWKTPEEFVDLLDAAIAENPAASREEILARCRHLLMMRLPPRPA